jgi:hypothetical protein
MSCVLSPSFVENDDLQHAMWETDSDSRMRRAGEATTTWPDVFSFSCLDPSFGVGEVPVEEIELHMQTLEKALACRANSSEPRASPCQTCESGDAGMAICCGCARWLCRNCYVEDADRGGDFETVGYVCGSCANRSEATRMQEGRVDSPYSADSKVRTPPQNRNAADRRGPEFVALCQACEHQLPGRQLCSLCKKWMCASCYVDDQCGSIDPRTFSYICGDCVQRMGWRRDGRRTLGILPGHVPSTPAHGGLTSSAIVDEPMYAMPALDRIERTLTCLSDLVARAPRRDGSPTKDLETKEPAAGTEDPQTDAAEEGRNK